MEPMVTKTRALDMQVCVPAEWTDDEVKRFADERNPSGLDAGWSIRTDAKLLNGDPVRNPCTQRAGMVHVTLDC